MKKYILIAAVIVISSSANAVPGVTISATTHVVATGSVQVSLSGGPLTFVNNGIYLDTTSTLNLLTGVTFSGTGTTTLHNLVVNATGTTSICNSPVAVRSTVTMTAGTLNANSNLTLVSTITGTARIAPIVAGSSITNNVNVQQYIPGKRGFRFFGHPFSSSIPLSQLETNIDITGTGGNANGFTSTITNNPSAFWFNQAMGDTITVGNNTGWVPFTSTNGAGANAWNPKEGIRVLVRGSSGQGLTTAAYTPNPVTINMNGPVNQGAVTETLLRSDSVDNDNSTYNLLSNPYPSPTDIGTVIHNAGANISGAAFWVWDATQQTEGAYVAHIISATPYYLPANASFTVSAAVNNSTLTFAESNKNATSSATLFKVADMNNGVTLNLYDSSMNSWDRLYISFNDKASATQENYDASKLHNSALDFYSFSANNRKLCVDARPYVAGQVIPLGITTSVQQAYTIKAEDFTLPAGTEVYLHDKYLNQYQQLQDGSQYTFTITSDAASQGDNRFELGLGANVSAGIASVNGSSDLKVSMVPNPATEQVTINYQSPQSGNTSVRIVNMAGQNVMNMELGDQQSGSVNIPLHNIASGMYMVTFTSGNQTVTQRLLKQ